MRGYRHLTLALLKSQLREPVGTFFLLIFAPAALVILGVIFGNAPRVEFGMHGFVDNMLPGIIVISVMIVGIMSVPQNQLMRRASGAMTRLRVTPLKPRTFVAADLTVNFAFGLTGAVIPLLIGVPAFGVSWPAHAVMVALALAFGLVAMLAVGYTLAALYPSVAAATGIGNGLMIVLMMTSGAFIPTEVMPDGIRAVMAFSPVYHIAALIKASWGSESWPVASTLVLLGVTVVFGTLGTVLFRRDRTK